MPCVFAMTIPFSYYLALSLAALLAFGLVWWIWRGEKRRERERTSLVPVGPALPKAPAVPAMWRRDHWNK